MKTLTLKADDQLDQTVSRLARSLKKTKSAVIREAIMNYETHLEREALKRHIKKASLVVRDEALLTATELKDAESDGI